MNNTSVPKTPAQGLSAITTTSRINALYCAHGDLHTAVARIRGSVYAPRPVAAIAGESVVGCPETINDQLGAIEDLIRCEIASLLEAADDMEKTLGEAKIA